MPELEIPGLKILEEIGRGGMARVYLAIQESLQRPVAVKLLHNPNTPGFHERFMNEGRYLAALSHSNIVEIYDVGECDGNYYIVMEYLPGGDLKSRIQKGMKSGQALKIAMQIARCLDYLHGQGMVHRDLKPANIMFRGDKNPVITDFGIAKLLQDIGDLTLSGSVLGSPSYLSPEQAGFAGKVDGRSDLYSLGVILFEMLTGERPFKGENFAAIIVAHHKDPVPKLPESLSRYQPIIERLLAKDPAERYRNGGELIKAVRDLNAAEVHHPPKNLKQEPIQHPAVKENADEKPARKSGKSRFKYLFVIALLLSVGGYSLFDDSRLERIVQPDEGVVQQQSEQSQEHPQEIEEPEPHIEAAAEKLTPKSVVASVKKTPHIESAAEKLTSKSVFAPVKKTPDIEPAVEKLAPKSVVVPVKRTPPPRRPPVKPKLSKVDQLLSLAYQRMDTLRLSYPKGDSAHDYFQKILKLDPENRAAKAGIRQIVRWYIEKAEQALNENKIKQAKNYIKRGMNIDKRHPKLIALQNRIEPPASVNKKFFDLFEKLSY